MLILGHQGEAVATVGDAGRVAMKPVTIARDLGDEVEIGTGITAADQVVNNPPDSLADGEQVRIAGRAAGRQASTRPVTTGGAHA